MTVLRREIFVSSRETGLIVARDKKSVSVTGFQPFYEGDVFEVPRLAGNYLAYTGRAAR